MKQVNRQFVTGVTVVTVMDGDLPRGLAVNAFSSISLEPPMVMVCVQRTSSTYECLFRASHLAINILSTDQLDVVNRFASKSADKFSGRGLDPRPVRQPLDRAEQRPDGGRDPGTPPGKHPYDLHRPGRRRSGHRPPPDGVQRRPVLRRRGAEPPWLSITTTGRTLDESDNTERQRVSTCRAGSSPKCGNASSAASSPPASACPRSRWRSQFGVSRTPVREALKQLQTEGLVEIRPRVGTFVTTPSRREIIELFEMKELLEGAAARLLAHRGRVPELDRLEQNLIEADRAADRDDRDRYAALVQEFHDLLIVGADNAKLEAHYRTLMNQLAYDRLVTTSLSQPGRVLQSDQEHHRVLEPILAKDGDTAERVMREHVRSSRRALMAGLDGSLAGGAPPRSHEGTSSGR